MPSTTQASSQINATTAAIRELIELKYIKSTRPGWAYDIPQTEINRLAAIPYVSKPHAPALIVCVELARKDTDKSNHRSEVGWNPLLSPFNPIQLAAVTQWWPANDPYAPEVIVVTNHGWVLHAYEIDGTPSRHVKRSEWSFPVLRRRTEKTSPFMGRRLTPRPGPVAYPLP